MRAGEEQGGLISPELFSLYVNDLPSTSHLGLYADDTAIIGMSRNQTVLVSYLSGWSIAINVYKITAINFGCAGRRFIQSRPVTLFGEPIEWVHTSLHLGVTLDRRLTWSPKIDQFRKRVAERIEMMDPLLNRKGDLPIKNGVLLYKQFIVPMTAYVYSAWRSTYRTHIRKVHVLQSKRLRLVTCARWYVFNRQIHDELYVPLFADHISVLTDSFDSKLADLWNCLVRQISN